MQRCNSLFHRVAGTPNRVCGEGTHDVLMLGRWGGHAGQCRSKLLHGQLCVEIRVWVSGYTVATFDSVARKKLIHCLSDVLMIATDFITTESVQFVGEATKHPFSQVAQTVEIAILVCFGLPINRWVTFHWPGRNSPPCPT